MPGLLFLRNSYRHPYSPWIVRTKRDKCLTLKTIFQYQNLRVQVTDQGKRTIVHPDIRSPWFLQGGGADIRSPIDLPPPTFFHP